MMQNENSKLAKRYGIGVLVAVVLGAVAAGVAMWFHVPTDAAPQPTHVSKAPASSMFSFTGTSNWWQGATNHTSMALFHTNSSDGCFASAEYHTGTIEIATELQKNQSMLASSGYTVSSIGTQVLNLQTNISPMQYQLVQYNVTRSSGATTQVMGGQELGYIQLAGGYLKLMGYCNTVNQLPATIPALQSIKFNKTT